MIRPLPWQYISFPPCFNVASKPMRVFWFTFYLLRSRSIWVPSFSRIIAYSWFMICFHMYYNFKAKNVIWASEREIITSYENGIRVLNRSYQNTPNLPLKHETQQMMMLKYNLQASNTNRLHIFRSNYVCKSFCKYKIRIFMHRDSWNMRVCA